LGCKYGASGAGLKQGRDGKFQNLLSFGTAGRVVIAGAHATTRIP
jgi:hypothetical protein